MGKGRKILNGALKLLRPNGDGAAIDLADTTPLGYYQAVVAGKKKVSYVRGADSKPKGYEVYDTIPFAEGSDPLAQKAKVRVSQRAIAGITGTGVTLALLNLTAYDDTSAAVNIAGYKPATATVNLAGTTSAPATSQVTGKRYNKSSNAKSYTYPVGLATTITDTDIVGGWKGVKANIIVAVEAGTAKRSVSFKPERY
jgi:hypothetical protein